MADDTERQEKEEKFFDKWMHRFRLGSAFGAVTAASVVAVGAVAAPVIIPVAGAAAAGLAVFAAGSKIVDVARRGKKSGWGL